MSKKNIMAFALCGALALGAVTGCTSATASAATASTSSAPSAVAQSSVTSTIVSASGNSIIGDVSDLFTDRDLAQTADLDGATEITVANGEDVNITQEGVYVISGTAKDVTITVEADSSAKVQLVLNGVSITNEDAPAIYVKSADKVFVTTAGGTTNALNVTGTFASDADANVDGVIFAKDDLVLNGLGTLSIKSSANGIVGKDDVKITGGTYGIAADGHGIQGKDSVAIADGTFTITAGKDGIHSENADDLTLGSIYIAGGTFDISAGSDGVSGITAVQIDNGVLTIDSAEGIEGTYVQINGGTVDVTATDDGINATGKSTAYDVTLEITGGKVSVNMGQGDTDALDSNGNLFISGGTVDIIAQSAFDYDGQGSLTGGTVTVNGTQVTELTASMMGGGPGGMGGMASAGGPNNMGGMGGRR